MQQPEAQASDYSILWNSHISDQCYQVRAGFADRNGKFKQEMWPIGSMRGYIGQPDRPRSCGQGGFLDPAGKCPDHIILVYQLMEETRGLPSGWDFCCGEEVIDGELKPYFEFSLEQDTRNPCEHREIALYHYSILGKMLHTQVKPNANRKDGLWPLSTDYDLIYLFKYRILERTPSICTGKPQEQRNLLKSIVMFDHLHQTDRIEKRRPNSISIWIDRLGGPLSILKEPLPWGDRSVLFWNQCNPHGDWGTKTCMLTLWAGDTDMVRPVHGSDYIQVEINLSQLFRRYSQAFPPPFEQQETDAVFRNIAVVGAAAGCKLRFRIADVDLRVRRRSAQKPA